MSQQQPQAMQPMMDQQQQPQDVNSNSYYPQDNDLTGGLPINLDSLRDGPPGSKPFYPYSTLIRYAIKGSPNQKLLLEDIYYAIESRVGTEILVRRQYVLTAYAVQFPYFRSAPSGWKNSVRHNLSLNPCFEKVPRPLTDRGKGSYWTVNENVDPRTGVHRVRKKKTKGSKNRGSEEVEQQPQAQEFHQPEPQPPAPQTYEDPNPHAHAQFVAPPAMHPDEAGPSRQQVPYPPPYPPFNPNFPMMAPDPRFPPPIPGVLPISPDEGFELDEHGNVNWRLAWLKELGHLQQITAEQEKAGVDPEWYRMMLFRVRSALMPPPPMNPEVMHGMPPPPPHMQPPPPQNAVEMAQQAQAQQQQTQ